MQESFVTFSLRSLWGHFIVASHLALPSFAAEFASPDVAARRDEPIHAKESAPTNYEEIVVSASPHPRERFDVIQGTVVLADEELEAAIRPTLGDTLAELPGITSSSFGPGSSRPVIRGLGGPRVRVLQDGIGVQDASVSSPDHAVAMDPLQTDRIEIVRGAATLRYGSSAIGGVVNVDDGRIPRQLGEKFEGDLRAIYGSASQDKMGALGINSTVGPVALRMSGFVRGSHDLGIPGRPISSALLAEDPDLEQGPSGRVPDSDTDSKGGNLGTAWFGEAGHVGAAYGIMESNYGVPSEPGEEIRIHLEQQRVDLRGEYEIPLAPFETASLRLGFGDYEHEELEEGEIATRVDSETWEGRLEFLQEEWRGLHGAMGIQFLTRDSDVSGEEAFMPSNEVYQWGLFAVEELELDRFTFEAGLRVEGQKLESSTVDFDKDYVAVSASLGAAWKPADDWLLGVSLSRSDRPPAAEEVLSDGPHLATAGFEIGRRGLDNEVGYTVEVTARKRAGRLRGDINLYYTRFHDFIFQRDGFRVDEEGLPDPDGELIRRTYEQADAIFYGGEAQLSLELFQAAGYTTYLDASADYVRAKERSSDINLPRIPPFRFRGGLEARSDLLDARVECWYVAAQNRNAPNELSTDSYVMVNASLILHPFSNPNLTLLIQGRNLGNEKARNHVSYLKDLVPLQGRDLRLGFRALF